MPFQLPDFFKSADDTTSEESPASLELEEIESTTTLKANKNTVTIIDTTTIINNNNIKNKHNSMDKKMPSVRNDWQSSKAQFVSARIFDSNRTGDDQYNASLSAFSTESLMFSDTSNKKTFARLVAEYLMDFEWYNPNRHNKEVDLREGWAFFEHVTLARSIADTERGASVVRALPGEKEKDTELYSFWKTGGNVLNEWGIGVALYFATLRSISICFLVAGLVSLPMMLYFSGTDYAGIPNHQNNLFFLRGTAICDDMEYAVCEEGWCDPVGLEQNNMTYWKTVDDDFTIVERSVCGSTRYDDGDGRGVKFWVGMCNYISVFILFIFTILFSFYQRNRAVQFDEDMITASDYSVMVHNPPEDATDPEEWRDFFSQFTADNEKKGVTVCTILLNNSLLLRKLIARRYFRAELQKWLPKINLDDIEAVEEEILNVLEYIKTRNRPLIGKCFDCLIKPIVKPFNKFLSPDVLYKKMNTVTDEIKELQRQHYDVSDVIVTFETEADQRNVLDTLKASKLDIRYNRHGSRSSELFRGKYVLDVDEPVEPSAVRYLDLDTGLMKKIILELIFFCVTIGLVVLSGFLVFQTRQKLGPQYAGVLTSLLNLVIPLLVKVMLIFERHDTEGSRQRSLFTKVALFRWTVTAIMPMFVTPYSRTLGSGKQDLLYTVRGILISEMFLVPVLRLMDFGGILSKHVFAPRARTRYQMLLCFRGTPYDLAERYTDVTKIVLLCCLYCSLFPQILIYGCLILCVRYYADKFALLRIWQPAPYIGTQLAKISMRIYFSLAVVISFVTSAYYWAYFPFDRVCKSDSDVELGEYPAISSGENKTVVPLEINDEAAVRVCSSETTCCQEMTDRFSFAVIWKRMMPTPDNLSTEGLEWMSSQQEDLNQVYGYTAFVIVVLFLTVMIVKPAVSYLHSLYKGSYSPDGQDQEVDFSNVKDMIGYIPRIYFGNHTYPMIACNTDNVDNALLGWNDPEKDHDFYNLTLDMQETSGVDELVIQDDEDDAMVEVSIDEEKTETNRDEADSGSPQMIFSTVTHWSPVYARKEE